MIGAESRHAPGMVAMVTGELARYADTLSDLEALRVPRGSGLSWLRGVLISDLLNESFERLYTQPGLEWVWVMGDDHRFLPETLLSLLDRDVDCIIPACVHRKPPFHSNVLGVNDDGSKQFKTMADLPTSGLYTLKDGESCGDAGILIRKRVLDAIERPWYDTRRSGAYASDDTAFTNRVRKAGFDIHVDCDVSLGHITPMAVTPVVHDDKWVLRINASDNLVCALGVKPNG